MKKSIVLVVLMFVLGTGNAIARSWDSVEDLSRDSLLCLDELQLDSIVSSECDSISSTTYVVKYVETTVKDDHGVPSFILRDPVIRLAGDRLIPISDLVIPVSKGKVGNYVSISIAGRFVRLDDDDPLKFKQKGKLSNVTFLVEAVKGRPPTFVEKLVGEVIVNKEYPDSVDQYVASKATRLKSAIEEESKVKIFGLPLYGATQDLLLIAMNRNSIQRTGSIHGYASDVFDTSKAVKGTAELDVFYNKNGSIGRLTYHFENSTLNDVLERFSRVYGAPDSNPIDGNTWTLGRIKIYLNSLKTEGDMHVTATYSVFPFERETLKGNLKRDHLVDSNAF